MKEDYPAFEKWINIQDWILEKCEKFPKSSRFTLSSKIINISLEITESIIKAIYQKIKKDILEKININVELLRVFFRISFNRKYISTKQYEFISKELNIFGSMIGGWIKSCKG